MWVATLKHDVEHWCCKSVVQLLRNQAPPAGEFSQWPFAEEAAAKANRARRRAAGHRKRLQQQRLAGPVWTYKAPKLPKLDAK